MSPNFIFSFHCWEHGCSEKRLHFPDFLDGRYGLVTKVHKWNVVDSDKCFYKPSLETLCPLLPSSILYFFNFGNKIFYFLFIVIIVVLGVHYDICKSS
jgi:hypothetical protein